MKLILQKSTAFFMTLGSCIAFLMSASAFAGVSPLGVSIFPPVQFPPQDFTIAGARINLLVGSHFKVYGFDFGGIGNITQQTSAGVQVAGAFNYNHGETQAVGLQLAGIGNWNINKARVVGFQVAGLINSNTAESFALGLVAAAVNLTEHTQVVGLEVGLYNTAHEVYGLQIGVVNKVDSLHGLQIGLINFNTRGLFAIAPILNVGF